MLLLDFIFTIWRTITDFISFGKKSISNHLSVYIKSNDGKTVKVDLDPKWDIKSVKELVGPKLGLEAEDIKIILAGKELDDSTTIEECDLGNQSTVYCVPSDHRNAEGSKPMNKILTDLSEEDVASFFVACSTCKGVKHGKLRVRCAECNSGAITVDRDPASWSDVLDPGVISGHCEETGCVTGAVSWCDFYFRCKEHSSEGDTAIPLSLIRANLRGVPCLACIDVLDSVLVFDCPEKHTICLECFSMYIEGRLRERRFISTEHGYTVPCPVGCDASLITETHHFRILPENLYQQYQRFAAEDYVLGGGGVLCPRPGCGAGIFPDSDCNRVTCAPPGCGYVFCKHCLEGYHIGDCETGVTQSEVNPVILSVDPTHAALARWNEASKIAIKVSTKPCPKCRIPTERAGGCMHMLCSRCSFEWCWVCQTEWTRDCMGSHWFG